MSSGRPIGVIGREQPYAVVPPITVAGEGVDRHQLDGGNAQVRQIIQFFDGCTESPFMGESADVEFIQHHFFPRSPLPVLIRPGETQWVDDF